MIFCGTGYFWACHLAVVRLHMRLLAEASRRRYAMSRPRLSRHSFGGELSDAPVENRSISEQLR